MKGIVLAGGAGSRLWPITKGVSKQLLPVYDKPLVHYPLGTLFLAGVREILIITTQEDQSSFIRLLGDGSQYGVNFHYRVQAQPRGLAEAFIIGEQFINRGNVALVLGDNIFHGSGFGNQLQNIEQDDGATIFAYKVNDPERYGVVEFDGNMKAISLEEKPTNPKSRFAVPGLYFYDGEVSEIAKSISPSERGEIEITSVNNKYLSKDKLRVVTLDRGTAWLDCGTIDSLYDATSYIKTIEERQGSKISCLEEIAWRNGWISTDKLLEGARSFGANPYGEFLVKLVNEN